MTHRRFVWARSPLFAVVMLGLASGCGMIDRAIGVTAACDLRPDGIAAPAEILSVWETGWSVNQEPVIGLRVKVEPDDRPAFEAVIPKALIDRLHIPQFQPGKTVPVVFDRQDPHKIGLDVYVCRERKRSTAR